MQEPESGQDPIDSTLTVEPPLSGVDEPLQAEGSAPEPFPGTSPNVDEPLPGTSPNADEPEEAEGEEPIAEPPAPRPRRRLRFRLKLGLRGRRPSLPRIPLGWNTRFKVAVVFSFLILVSVLLVNRVTRGRHSASDQQAEGAPPTLMIQGQAQSEPLEDSAPSSSGALAESVNEPPLPDLDSEEPRFEVASRGLSTPDEPEPAELERDDAQLEADDETLPPPTQGDGLIQASNSEPSPPLPAESRLSVASRDSLETSIEDEPPLPAIGPAETLASDPEPDDEDDPPALDGINPPVRVAASEALAEPISSELQPPDPNESFASLDEPSEQEEPQFNSFQDLPPPSFGMADTAPAEPEQPSATEPAPESTEVAAREPEPSDPVEPATAESFLQPPVDSLEGLETPAMAQDSEPSAEPDSTDLDGDSAPGSLMAMRDPSTDFADAQPSSAPPETAATAPFEPLDETETPEEEPPAEPSTLAARLEHETAEPEPAESPDPAASPAPPTEDPAPAPTSPAAPPSPSEPTTSPSEPAALVLEEVPKRSHELDQSQEVVGGRIEPVTHVVRRGENFFTIARYYYGSGRFYRALWKANADRVPKIDELYVGTQILVPPPEDLDKAHIDPPGPRPMVGSSPSSSVSPDRDDLAERAAASRSERRTDRRGEEIEMTLPSVVPASATLEPLFPPSDSDWLDEEIPAPRSGMRVHIVQPYETLRSIAREELGDSRWESELLRLNTDQVEDPHNLEVGLRLRLPEGTRRD